ncbi:M28 family peptidase [Thermocrinis minervae]|uniref:Peptidase family M28 n=1 Tax=Thermocrinis minervae TaxID=381751 RepID=A0A1M6QG29_9AQUI|nr:M28 family peptidase [Thermocrinis minervae]SHK19017.1 Peptidase family M28 [Thermocrinis minervae]
MKNSTFEELKERAESLLREERFLSSKEPIKRLLKDKGIPYQEEKFEVEVLVPQEVKLQVDNRTVPAVGYVGSPNIEVEGYVKEDPLAGDIALTPKRSDRRVFQKLKEKGVKAIITYMEDLDAHFHGSAVGLDLPIINVRKEHVELLKDAYVKLKVKSKLVKTTGTNLLSEVGRGAIFYLVAHTDTKPGTFGAIDNGIGFLTLIYIFDELRRDYKLPFKLRLLLTDFEEVGLLGSKHHVQKLPKHTYYCINVDSIGWTNPSVLYKDAEGYNGQTINEKFFKHASEFSVNIEWKAVPSAISDHIPFKQQGVETLFLTSHPFSIRHTPYDNVHSIDWDMVRMWFDLILSFIRRFHKI